ncbi:sulfatase-like hydrolase/transferase [Xinfangfangia sp. CPCC 101601]|uniref:Sulfatase-like hydrolase/transferase n=1 Tax=Pseudogemmobacter lacusdianii TaxID=3069608 RepID=A0ABU0VXZ3_9RHOB|nr:sulfatase-like hydrolase/transferase [Xinfangfangia sp. CPCC 101601]MDQ2066584.1 sulfatase-like hydrolase/transferase [Xinfangfangia sp. CPCC 101601]
MSFDRASIANGNICLIWIDDLIDIFTWRDAFGVTIQTPNIDRLMAQGTRFANAYATIPLCAPCRAEVSTGLSPFVTGLVDLNRFWRDALPPTASWVYDLRRAGFHCFTTGKTDANYKPMPEDYRRVLFHEDVAADDRGRRRHIHKYLDTGPGIEGVNHPNDDGAYDHTFYDHSVAQNAIDFLGRADPKRRNLIQLGFKHPHYNLTCPDRFYQMYDPDQIIWPRSAHPDDYHGPQPGMAVYEMAYIVNGRWTPEKAGDAAWRQVVRAYFAACSHVDHEIGRFLDALQASALGQNTTVMLVSDNGFNLGTHDSFHKMSQWDAAAHVPLGLWHAGMAGGQVVDCPVSLHNIPKTILDLAGLPARPDWPSGQSLLPLLDESFGSYDRSQSPLTAVFGTLSVRPSDPALQHLRYFRYPSGEEHVYDLVRDPGETTNLIGCAETQALRNELVAAAARLGLDLSGLEKPDSGLNAMMAMDGAVVLQGPPADSHFWAYGAAADRLQPAPGGQHVLWYLGGPDGHVLRVPAGIGTVRIGTVTARDEADGETPRAFEVVAHPESAILFEASERVPVRVRGSHKGDRMYGPVYAGAQFEGGDGDDLLVAISNRRHDEHAFYGGAGNDTLIGAEGRATLDGGAGDDVIYGGTGFNRIYGGPGNDLITDGDRSSVIHTGPGRNVVTAGDGAHIFHIGPGENTITGGPGGNSYHIAYGGICRILDYRPEDRLVLEAWPQAPKIAAEPKGVTITLGLSALILEGVTDLDAVEASLAPAPKAKRRK